MRSRSEGLLLRDDEREAIAVAWDQRRIGRDDESLADEERMKRLLIQLEPVDAIAIDFARCESGQRGHRFIAPLFRIEIRGDDAVLRRASCRRGEKKTGQDCLFLAFDLEGVNS